MAKKPKAVLITGASRRLGLAAAQKCLELGFAVVIHYRSSPEPARRSLLRNAPSKVHFVPYELSNNPQGLLAAVEKLPVSLVGLINNASEFTEGNLRDIDHLTSIVAVNSFAPVQLCERFAESVHKGWVVNITDAHVRQPNLRFQNYRISKILLDELTRQLAFQLAPAIRVNALAPGAMLPASGSDKSYFESLSAQIPLRRTGDLKSLTHALEFLITNAYVTGVSVAVDGGWHLL